MNVSACIRTRRSIRRFKAEPADTDTVKQAVALASYAPSWKNSQTVRYIWVSSREEKARLLDCMAGFDHNRRIIEGAPGIMVLTTVDRRSGYERDGSFTTSKGTHWQSFDAGIAAQTFCLAACELGLGTVMMGIFDEDRVRTALDIPDGQSVSVLIAVGYADENPLPPNRKTVDELLTIR